MNKAKNKKADLIASKFKQLLFVGILSWLVLLIGQVIDNIYAGQFLNEAGLSAVQIITPFNTFISAVATLTGMGFAVKFSHLKGQGDETEASKNIGLGLLFTILIGVILGLLLLFCKEPLLNLFNMTPQVREYASSYYDWYIGLAFVQPLFVFFYKVISQDGDPLWTTIASVGQVAINASTSIFLIQSMGINGLSLGTFISVICSLILVLMHFFTKKNSIKIKLCFNFKKLKDPMRFGFPALLGNVSMAIVNLVINAFITATYGDTFLASFTIINFIINLKLVFSCVPESVAPFINTAKGAKNNDDIKKCIAIIKKWDTLLSLITMTIVMSLCLLIPQLFGIKPSSNQFEYSYLAVLIIAPSFICQAFIISIGLTYTNLGKPSITLINQLVCNFFFPIITPLLLALAFGYIGIIIGYSVSGVFGVFTMSIGLIIKNKPHKVFVLPYCEEIQFSVDSYIDEASAQQCIDIIYTSLKELNVEANTINKVIGLVEDSYPVLRKFNPNNIVTVHMTYAISDNQVRIISKNNGRFISKEEKEKESIENKLDHVYLSYAYESASINLSTMITFNSSSIAIKRVQKS